MPSGLWQQCPLIQIRARILCRYREDPESERACLYYTINVVEILIDSIIAPVSCVNAKLPFAIHQLVWLSPVGLIQVRSLPAVSSSSPEERNRFRSTPYGRSDVKEPNDTRLNIGEPDPFSAAGLAPEVRLPLTRLQDLQERSGFGVYLYFDEHLARNSTLEADVRDFQIVPPQARPFMPLQGFVRIMIGIEADFLRRMQEEPPDG
jgi:hypothetical protein